MKQLSFYKSPRMADTTRSGVQFRSFAGCHDKGTPDLMSLSQVPSEQPHHAHDLHTDEDAKAPELTGVGGRAHTG